MPRDAGIGIALEIGDDLGAEQQDQRDGLHGEQHDDDGGHRAVDHVDDRDLGVVGDQQVAGDFPQDGGGDAAGECAAEGDPGHRHDLVKQREKQDQPEHSGQIDDQSDVVVDERVDAGKRVPESGCGRR